MWIGGVKASWLGAITEEQEEPSAAVALAAAERFGIKLPEAKRILREVFNAVAGWRATGRKLRLTAGVLDTYASAFEHPLITEAAQILRA